MQSRIQSFIEANINTAIGFVVSMLLAYFVLPYFGLEKSVKTSLEVVLIFTFASIVRNYLVRRLFNKWSRYGNKRN